MEDANAKYIEISTEKKYLQDSWVAVLLYQKGLENEFERQRVVAVGMYFEWAKVQVLFLDLDKYLIPLDLFKVVKGGPMMDEEAMTSPKLRPFPNHKEGVI